TLVTEPELYWTQDDENERLNLPEVDAQFFSMLGGIPEIGRGVVPRDTNPDAPGVLILSHAFWKERFGGARDIVGRQIRVARSEELSAPHESYTIVGVMPDRIDYPEGVQRWIAVRAGPPRTGRAAG